MALPILDGNQSATTLSSILTSGEHIPAHTVVSLGTQAITDMRGAVSGSVVSISNFPATQPVSIASVTIGNSVTIGSLPAISGTVTASNVINGFDLFNAVTGNLVVGTGHDGAVRIVGFDPIDSSPANLEEGGGVPICSAQNLPLPISGTVTVGNTVTIAGTVTANPTGTQTIAGSVTLGAGTAEIGTVKPAKSQSGTSQFLAVDDASGKLFTSTLLTAGTAQIGSVTASISNSVTIGSLPAISGTVTATIRNGEDAILNDAPSGYTVIRALSHWFDDVVDNEIKNTSQTNPLPISGTVTANIAGNLNGAIEIVEDNGNASHKVAVQIYGANGVPLGDTSLPISGTVTANTFALQGTAVTTSNFTSTTASTLLAGYNATREVLTIFNEGAGNLHVCAGATCTTIAYQVRLSAGDYYEVPNHQTTITHSAVFATAGTARVTEVS